MPESPESRPMTFGGKTIEVKKGTRLHILAHGVCIWTI